MPYSHRYDDFLPTLAGSNPYLRQCFCVSVSKTLIETIFSPAGAVSAARRMVGSLDPTHLHWIVDLDGQQLLPELRYYGQCLSSEAPGSFLAAYWKGRKDGLW